ncbi:hypothetical protein BC827DRAFT_1380620 [Russula dissimulans]|nr:hypothetical protein BC827DRAFT_1380620 [Russula dissimulans]
MSASGVIQRVRIEKHSQGRPHNPHFISAKSALHIIRFDHAYALRKCLSLSCLGSIARPSPDFSDGPQGQELDWPLSGLHDTYRVIGAEAKVAFSEPGKVASRHLKEEHVLPNACSHERARPHAGDKHVSDQTFFFTQHPETSDFSQRRERLYGFAQYVCLDRGNIEDLGGRHHRVPAGQGQRVAVINGIELGFLRTSKRRGLAGRTPQTPWKYLRPGRESLVLVSVLPTPKATCLIRASFLKKFAALRPTGNHPHPIPSINGPVKGRSSPHHRSNTVAAQPR